jgi:hypothetical protein
MLFLYVKAVHQDEQPRRQIILLSAVIGSISGVSFLYIRRLSSNKKKEKKVREDSCSFENQVESKSSDISCGSCGRAHHPPLHCHRSTWSRGAID